MLQSCLRLCTKNTKKPTVKKISSEIFVLAAILLTEPGQQTFILNIGLRKFTTARGMEWINDLTHQAKNYEIGHGFD